MQKCFFPRIALFLLNSAIILQSMKILSKCFIILLGLRLKHWRMETVSKILRPCAVAFHVALIPLWNINYRREINLLEANPFHVLWKKQTSTFEGSLTCCKWAKNAGCFLEAVNPRDWLSWKAFVSCFLLVPDS